MSTFARNWFIFWLALAALRFVVLGYWTRFYVQTYKVDEEGIALLRSGTESARVPWEGMSIERTLLPVEHATWQLRTVYILIALFVGYFPPVHIKGRDHSCLEIPWWGGMLRHNPVLMAFAMYGPHENAIQRATKVVPIPIMPRTAPSVAGQAGNMAPEAGSTLHRYVVGTPDVALFPIRFILGNHPLFFGLLSLTLLSTTHYVLPVALILIAIGLWVSAKCVLTLIAAEKLPWRYCVTEEDIQRIHLGQVIAYPWASLDRVTVPRSGFVPALLGHLRELAIGPQPVILSYADGADLVLPRAPRMSFYRSRLEDARYHCAMMGPDDNLLYRACLQERRFCKFYQGRGSRKLRALVIASTLPAGVAFIVFLCWSMGDPPPRRLLPLIVPLLALTALQYFMLLNGGPIPRTWTQADYRAQVRGDRVAEVSP